MNITYLFRATNRDSIHTNIAVFAGINAGSRGHCGVLTMRNEEWENLKASLCIHPNIEVEDELERR